MNTDSGISAKLFNQVAQLGHFAGGAAIVFAFAVIGKNSFFSLAGFFTVFVLAAIKEFWYDEKYETPAVRGISMEDFFFYLLGAGIASIISSLSLSAK